MGKHLIRTAIGILVMGTVLAFAVGLPAASDPDRADTGKLKPLDMKDEKAGYALGVETGRNFKRQGIEVDPDSLSRGIMDALNGNKLSMSDEELLLTLNAISVELRDKREKTRLLSGFDNKKAGAEFLEANKTKEGVVILPNGLQYKVLETGGGKKPSETDTAEVNCRGYLIDGKEFLNTESTGPAFLKLSDHLQVIPGLREALKRMEEGSKWQIFVPPSLAYGQRGMGRYIGPYATLIYEVELLTVR